MADAALAIIRRDSRSFTGHFCIDDEVLAEEGVVDLTPYAVDPTAELAPDFFV
jgi:citronellol/citronellal dehydrogenase